MFLANSETAVEIELQSCFENPMSLAKFDAAINERVASASERIRRRNEDLLSVVLLLSVVYAFVGVSVLNLCIDIGLRNLPLWS